VQIIVVLVTLNFCTSNIVTASQRGRGSCASQTLPLYFHGRGHVSLLSAVEALKSLSGVFKICTVFNCNASPFNKAFILITPQLRELYTYKCRLTIYVMVIMPVHIGLPILLTDVMRLGI